MAAVPTGYRSLVMLPNGIKHAARVAIGRSATVRREWATVAASTDSSRDEAFGALAPLANTRSHAHAARVSLSASRRGRSLTIRVEDDGVGFDSTGGEPTPSHGSGMGIMRERMGSIYGRVLVTSSVGERAVVRFRVPVARGSVSTRGNWPPVALFGRRVGR